MLSKQELNTYSQDLALYSCVIILNAVKSKKIIAKLLTTIFFIYSK